MVFVIFFLMVIGLATRSQFSLNFVRFDAETAQFEFDVILKGSTIYQEHAISDIPAKKVKPVVRALEHFLGVDSVESKLSLNFKYLVGIVYFIVQTKKNRLSLVLVK